MGVEHLVANPVPSMYWALSPYSMWTIWRIPGKKRNGVRHRLAFSAEKDVHGWSGQRKTFLSGSRSTGHFSRERCWSKCLVSVHGYMSKDPAFLPWTAPFVRFGTEGNPGLPPLLPPLFPCSCLPSSLMSILWRQECSQTQKERLRGLELPGTSKLWAWRVVLGALPCLRGREGLVPEFCE